MLAFTNTEVTKEQLTASLEAHAAADRTPVASTVEGHRRSRPVTPQNRTQRPDDEPPAPWSELGASGLEAPIVIQGVTPTLAKAMFLRRLEELQ